MKSYRAPSFKLRKSAKAILSTNGERLAQITQRVVVFDVRQRNVCCEVKALKNEWHVAISPDGRMLAIKGENGELAFSDVDTATVFARSAVPGFRDTGCCPIFSPDGKLLVDGSWDGSIRIWDVAMAKELERIEHPGFMVSALTHAANDGRFFALMSRIGDVVDYRVLMFDLKASAGMQEIDPAHDRVSSRRGWAPVDHIAVDPDARHLLLAVTGRAMEERNCILSLNLKNGGASLAELPSRRHFVQGLCCGSDGLAVASVRENLLTPGVGSREFIERERTVERSHLHFFDSDGMSELCRWHWKDAWMVGISEAGSALYVASRDEPGGYLADYAFKLTAGEKLRSSERFRSSVV